MMRKNLCILLLSILSIPLIGQSDDNWELRKEKNGIQVYTKNVEGSDFKAYRGTTTLQTELSAIVAAIRDIPSYASWMPNASSARTLEQKGDTSIIYYLTTDAPWPVKDRDGIYQMRFRPQDNGALRIAIEDLPDYLPRKEDFVRIPRTEGYWLLDPVADRQVRVTYQISVNPGGSVPSWLANPMSVSQPYQTLRALNQRVQLDKYKGKQYSFLP